MKKAQQSIAIVLLGIVALIAIVGLIILMSKPTGASIDPRTYTAPLVQTQSFNWNSLVGFTASNDKVAQCAAGQWSQTLNGQQPACYAVTQDYVPSYLGALYVHASGEQGFAVACFAQTQVRTPTVC